MDSNREQTFVFNQPKTFAAWPERIYILGPGGKVLYKGGMGPFEFDPNDAEKALAAAGS